MSLFLHSRDNREQKTGANKIVTPQHNWNLAGNDYFSAVIVNSFSHLFIIIYFPCVDIFFT